MKTGKINREVAFAGQRITQKVALGLALCSVIPLLVLTYFFYFYFLPFLDTAWESGDLFRAAALVLFTGLLMAGGGLVFRDVAIGVTRAASLVTGSAPPEPSATPRSDEIGALVASFTKMAATIETQAEEIRQFPVRFDQVARLALKDPLTGLPNRALFMDRLAHALARTERRADHLAVLFLDLDRFKVINDSLGHSAGDRLLVEVSRRLQGCVRPEDTVARLGGDEFGILLEGGAEADGVAERITSALKGAYLFDRREVFVTASIGIVLNPSPRSQPEDILRNADRAMYHAKTQGKAQFAVFDARMNAAVAERLELEMNLRSALRGREFRLYYQPVINLATGRVTEMEALIRWEHRMRGLLLPEDFIGLTEETGLIVPIGRWVLAEACWQARQWQTDFPAEPPLVMGVNLSARQVQQDNLVEEIAGILRQSGLAPHSLRLEITENVVMNDAPATLAKLHALRDLGVRLAIDDFGTGYSSLNYLQRFPVETLKIDRSFVKGIGQRAEDTAIVQAVITVAKSLGLQVTAEGIETDKQLTRLLALGCDRGQGYYFARPLAADRIRALMSNPPWGEAALAAAN
ncbi:MAG TPA: EAL domain-containing protein [Methylomirabilota bacterium]|nr:EAL domain-containing protein [Methylomirabilota bacterium]